MGTGYTLRAIDVNTMTYFAVSEIGSSMELLRKHLIIREQALIFYWGDSGGIIFSSVQIEQRKRIEADNIPRLSEAQNL